MDDYYFRNFYNSKTRGNWRVGVYSYYYVYKFVADPRCHSVNCDQALRLFFWITNFEVTGALAVVNEIVHDYITVY